MLQDMKETTNIRPGKAQKWCFLTLEIIRNKREKISKNAEINEK